MSRSLRAKPNGATGLLMTSTPVRLAGALAGVALLWLAVAWALA